MWRSSCYWHASFVADEIWGDTLEPARISQPKYHTISYVKHVLQWAPAVKQFCVKKIRLRLLEKKRKLDVRKTAQAGQNTKETVHVRNSTDEGAAIKA